MLKSHQKLHRFSTDTVARNLATCLLEDFRPFIDVTSFQNLLNKGSDWPVAFREECSKIQHVFVGEPHVVKRRAQLLQLFKKYIFVKDMYTPSQVAKMSEEKFLLNQTRLNAFEYQTSSKKMRTVLSYARGWLGDILGDWDSEEHLDSCYFGPKSTVGIPLRLASEASRWDLPLTGSADQIAWFRYVYLAWNRVPGHFIRDLVGGALSTTYREVDCLEAVQVPKTYKSTRMIMANTTIGNFYSAGLGAVMTRRLLRAGYNIQKLQSLHGLYAKIGSSDGSLVTADQSLASDNITDHLIGLLFPDRWAFALRKGRINKIRMAGTQLTTNTFSTMGIGFTFPLQTLVFLSLLKAICLYRGQSTTVSAYGDDLIYHHSMHTDVVEVFQNLGLVINEDKTFASGEFRESCGYDFYRGFDVRPFLLGGAGSFLTKRRYEAFLYQTINGLLRRWSAIEIPSALAYLGGQLAQIGVRPYLIPKDYPDTAGVRASTYRSELSFLTNPCIPKIDTHGTVTFRYLAFKAELRLETRHMPYLWKSLWISRAKISGEGITMLPDPVTGYGHKNFLLPVEDRITFIWKRVKLRPRSYRNSDGKRVHPLEPFTPFHGEKGRYLEQRGSTCFWIHDR